MRMIKMTARALAVLLALSGVARADGFNPSVVPTSAVWILHVDMSGLKGLAVGRSLMAHPQVADSPQLADFTTRFGLDPRRDLRGVTFYTVSTGRLDAVAVIDPEPASAARLQAWREAGGFTGQAYGTHTIYNRSTGQGIPFHAVVADGRIVTALAVDGVRRGLDVLDRKTAPLALSAFPALADRKSGAGAIFLLAGRAFGPEMQGLLPQISMLRKAGSLCLTLGEKGGQVAAVLSVSAEEEPEAERLQNTLLAFVEIGRAMAANDSRPDPAQSVTVTREGKMVHAEGAWKIDEILKMMGGPRAP